MMNKLTRLFRVVGLTAVMASAPLAASAVTFNFSFFDGSGTEIGTGFYTFDEVAPDTQIAFDALTNFSWGFSVPLFGISIGSATSDSPSSEALSAEGIVLTGNVGMRTLGFYDDDDGLIYHFNDTNFAEGVLFTEGSFDVEYIAGPTAKPSGSYTAVEQAAPIPLPAGFVLLGSALPALMLIRRRRKPA